MRFWSRRLKPKEPKQTEYPESAMIAYMREIIALFRYCKFQSNIYVDPMVPQVLLSHVFICYFNQFHHPIFSLTTIVQQDPSISCHVSIKFIKCSLSVLIFTWAIFFTQGPIGKLALWIFFHCQCVRVVNLMRWTSADAFTIIEIMLTSLKNKEEKF